MLMDAAALAAVLMLPEQERGARKAAALPLERW